MAGKVPLPFTSTCRKLLTGVMGALFWPWGGNLARGARELMLSEAQRRAGGHGKYL